MASLGLLIALIALLAVLWTIIQYFTMHITPGWSSMIAATFLMGGLTIFSIGIVGIYVGNIFMEVKHRPLYVVRTVLNAHNTNAEE